MFQTHAEDNVVPLCADSARAALRPLPYPRSRRHGAQSCRRKCLWCPVPGLLLALLHRCDQCLISRRLLDLRNPCCQAVLNPLQSFGRYVASRAKKNPAFNNSKPPHSDHTRCPFHKSYASVSALACRGDRPVALPLTGGVFTKQTSSNLQAAWSKIAVMFLDNLIELRDIVACL